MGHTVPWPCPLPDALPAIPLHLRASPPATPAVQRQGVRQAGHVRCHLQRGTQGAGRHPRQGAALSRRTAARSLCSLPAAQRLRCAGGLQLPPAAALRCTGGPPAAVQEVAPPMIRMCFVFCFYSVLECLFCLCSFHFYFFEFFLSLLHPWLYKSCDVRMDGGIQAGRWACPVQAPGGQIRLAAGALQAW